MNRLAVALSLAMWAALSFAQPYPNKPIKVVLPYPPGGTTDTMGRITAQRLEAHLKVPVVVENRPGASGSIGSDSVRKSPADGYTLLFNASVFLLGKSVLKATPYDPVSDFTAIGRVGQTPLLVLAAPDVPVTTIRDLVALAKRDPRKFIFGNSAAGSAGHLATIDFNRISGLDLDIVTYKGSVPAMTDLMGGRIQLMIDPIVLGLQNVRAGKLKALGVTSRERVATAPEIQTTAESGMPDLVFSSWYGVWGPKDLPPDVVAVLAQPLRAMSKEAETRQRLGGIGVEPVEQVGAEFAAFIAQEVRRNDALLKAAKFQPE
jgi:tripartite-type tricarboxylate transporter receptor subunit TctC